MVAISEQLQVLFPNAVPYRDWLTMNGQIIRWNLPDPQPTPEQIASVTDADIAFLPYTLHSVESTKVWLANERWTRESAGIFIGEQFVSTNRDEMPVWQGMVLDAFVLRPGAQATYEYKPRGGANTTLTPQQVGRCYECFAWYVGALFAVERNIALMLDGTTSVAERKAILSAIPWPQTQFEWISPQ